MKHPALLSRFIAKITSGKDTTRTLCNDTEVKTEINGWNTGIEVIARPRILGQIPLDAFDIRITSGSTPPNNGNSMLLATVLETANVSGKVVILYDEKGKEIDVITLREYYHV